MKQRQPCSTRPLWPLLWVLNATAFLTAFVGSAINLAVPHIGRTFGHPSLVVGWVVSSFIIASVAVLVPLGALSDRSQRWRHRIFLGGLLLFTLASILSPWAPNLLVLILCRILQGIASGAIYATQLAILTENVPALLRGRAIGLNVSSVYVGLSVGPVIGGWITHVWGWPGVFYWAGGVGLLVNLAAFLLLPRDSGREGSEESKVWRWGDAACFSLGITLAMLGIAALTYHPWAWLLIPTGVVLLAVFTYLELQREHPLMNLRLFANRGYAFSNLAALISYAATFAVGFVLSIYLQDIRGLTSAAAGSLLLAQPVVMALVAPFAGRLSEKVQPRLLASLGMGLTAVALFGLVWLTATIPLGMVIVALVVLGFGFGLFSSPNANGVMNCVTPQHYGVAGSTLATMRVLGNTLSMSLVMVLAGVTGADLLGATQATQLTFTRVIFGFFAALCFAGVFLSLQRGHIPVPESPRDGEGC